MMPMSGSSTGDIAAAAIFPMGAPSSDRAYPIGRGGNGHAGLERILGLTDAVVIKYT